MIAEDRSFSTVGHHRIQNYLKIELQFISLQQKFLGMV